MIFSFNYFRLMHLHECEKQQQQNDENEILLNSIILVKVQIFVQVIRHIKPSFRIQEKV